MKKYLPLFAVLLGLLSPTSAFSNDLASNIKESATEGLASLSVWAKKLKAKESICVIGFQFQPDGEVSALSSNAEKHGLKLGDKVLTMNGEELSQDNANSLLGKHKPGDLLELTVERDGNEVLISAPCVDNTDYARALLNMLGAEKKGKWAQCIKYAYEAENAYAPEAKSSSMGPYFSLQRLNCNEAKRCPKGRCAVASSQDATYIYDYRIATLDAASKDPEVLTRIRADVLSAVDWLKKYGFPSLAADLNRQFLIVSGQPTQTPSVGAPAREQVVSYGTCFSVDDFTVLTSHHVIDGASSLTVSFSDGVEVPAKVTQFSQATDLAVLQIEQKALASLSLAVPRTVSVGEQVFTIGFPASSILGHEPKYTDGAVSSLSGLQGDASFIQMSVPIQPGNSGGPVVNFDGEVVGIVAATAAVESFYARTGVMPQNVNWASKSDYARMLFDPPPQKPKANSREEAVKMVGEALCRVKAVGQ